MVNRTPVDWHLPLRSMVLALEMRDEALSVVVTTKTTRGTTVVDHGTTLTGVTTPGAIAAPPIRMASMPRLHPR